MASVRAFKPIFSKWLSSKMLQQFGPSGLVKVKVDLADMPQHAYKAEPLKTSLARTLPDYGWMAILAVIFFAGAYLSFRRYDVR